jgi:hypothetical protein
LPVFPPPPLGLLSEGPHTPSRSTPNLQGPATWARRSAAHAVTATHLLTYT